MATCANVPNRANSIDFNQNMPLSECMCPICMSILVEPVTLPCKHELCMPCFRMNINETSMTCPMCRIRIATWSRQAARKKTLINQKRWNQIKRLFPEQVNKRLAGMDEDDLLQEGAVTPSLSEPGEIRKEYEEELRRLEAEEKRQRQSELAASEALIRQLQEEDNQLKESWKKRKTKLAADDEVLAKQIASENELPTRVMRSKKKGLMDKFVVRSPAGSKPTFPEPCTSAESPGQANSAAHSANSGPQSANSGPQSANSGLQVPNCGPKSANSIPQPADSAPISGENSKNSTSKSRSPYADFFQPRPRSKSASSAQDSSGFDSSSRSVNFVSTDNLVAQVRSQLAACKKELNRQNQLKQLNKKVSQSNKVIHSFVDKEKINSEPSEKPGGAPGPEDSEPKPGPSGEPGSSKPKPGTSEPKAGPSGEQGSTTVKTELNRSASTDSISQELVHFQPIQACPRTPPKRLPSGRMLHAPVIKCKPLNLPSPEPCAPAPITSKSEHHSPVIRRQVAFLEAQRLAKVGERSKAEQTDTSILFNRSPSSPFRTISIGQKRLHGIGESPAKKKLRFDLGGSDASDTYNVGAQAQVANCIRKKLEKPEVIVIDSESTQSSCIIIEEKSTMKPKQNGSNFLKKAEWLDSMGDENNSDNSEHGALECEKKRQPAQAPVYIVANRVRFNPPRESPAAGRNVDEWLRKSQADGGDPLSVQPADTARRCFSNPGRTVLPDLTRDDLIKRASEDDDRSRSVCSSFREQIEKHRKPKPHKTHQTTLFKGKKVPNKDKTKTRSQKSKTSKQPKNARSKAKGKTKVKCKKENHRVVSPTSGEEAGAESDDDPDVRLARKLQKQFDLEAKWNMKFHKGHATEEDYAFRKRRHKSESSS